MLPAQPPSRPTRPRRPARLRLRPRRRHHEHPRSRRLRWRLAVAAAAVAAGLVATAAAAPTAAGQAEPSPVSPAGYTPPVDAPVVDPFRPPSHPFGSGNRGLEYDTRPGEPVRACAAGTVTFAGRVAGSNHVTVHHGDGVRTSYSYLGAIAVVRGQRVGQGEVLGTAGEVLHLGARVGDAYIDPASLFGGGPVTVELLPFAPPRVADVEERLAAVLHGGAGLGLGLPGLPDLGDGLVWLRERAGVVYRQVHDLAPGHRLLGAALDLGERLLFPGPCSDGDPPPAPVRGRDRIAVTVAGLGSSSARGSIDDLRTGDLGYDDGRVVRFSYAGGKAVGSGAAVDVPASTYGPADTQGDLRLAARRLADLVEAVLAAEPGATVDLFAHSQGGVVARLALLELERRGVPLRRLGVVATLATPHRGADLATAVRAARTGMTSSLALDAIAAVVGSSVDPDAAAVRQLAETSDVVRELGERGVPSGVALVSLAARTDPLVASPRTEVDGAVNVTVPVDGWHAHSELVGSEVATGELARALAGQPPACEGVGDVVADVAAGHAISYAEDIAGFTALAVAP